MRLVSLASLLWWLCSFPALATESTAPVPVAELDREPQVVSRVAPDYPMALALRGQSGEVQTLLTVGVDGRVEAVALVRASDEQFVPNSVRALRRWRFQSGTKAGVPVRYLMPYTMHFAVEGEGPPGGRKAPVEVVAQVVSQPRLPPLLDRDGHPEQGRIVVDVVVDEQGHPDQVRVVSGSHRRLRNRAVETVRQWQFAPATKDGRPVKSRLRLTVEFGPATEPEASEPNSSRREAANGASAP